MQSWARQFNLSETTFVTASRAESTEEAEADVRIFTASYEMPFAGHPDPRDSTRRGRTGRWYRR